jgi:uncharacterized membrane protein
MDESAASVVSYLVGWISGLIFLMTDKRPFVRFHAAQSVLVFGLLNIVCLLLLVTSFSGLSLLLFLVTMGLWVTLMLKANQGQWYELPLVAEIAAVLPAPLAQTFAVLTPKGSGAPGSGAAGSNSSGSGQSVSSGAISGGSGPALAFDPKNAAATAQLVGFIGHWTEADAAKVWKLGAAKREALDDGTGVPKHTASYPYRDYTTQLCQVDLTFNDQSNLLEMVSLNPVDVSLQGVQQALGNKGVRSDIPGTPWKTYNYGELHVGLIVDDADKVRKIVFSAGADPKSLFAESANWPAGIPWMRGGLVGVEDLPKFS